MNIRTSIAAAALTTFLAGCQSASYNPAPMAPPQPQFSSIDGEWIGDDGVAVSNFSNGTFTSYLVQTGEPLTRGKYNRIDETNVVIDFYSQKSKTYTKVNCFVIGTSQMNCTAASGSTFRLMRRA